LTLDIAACLGFLTFSPFGDVPAIGAVPMFGNQPFEPEFASLVEKIRADFALLGGYEEGSVPPSFQQSREVGFAKAQWQLAQIITVEREAIERVRLNLDVVLSGARSGRI
jgi:hypothetical protein